MVPNWLFIHHDFKSKEYLELKKRLGNKDKENQGIIENQADIAKQFTKILEFAQTDPEGFIKHMKNK